MKIGPVYCALSSRTPRNISLLRRTTLIAREVKNYPLLIIYENCLIEVACHSKEMMHNKSPQIFTDVPRFITYLQRATTEGFH